MTWARFRESVGKMWGATTTFLLTAGVAVQPILQEIDPTIVKDAPWLKWVLLGSGLAMALLRAFAPPPPSVPIHIDDDVEVDHELGTVTVTKAKIDSIPADVVSKAAGDREKV